MGCTMLQHACHRYSLLDGVACILHAKPCIPRHLLSGDASLSLLPCARRCWAQRPDERPSFHEVVQELRRLLTMSEESPSPAALPLTVSQRSAGRSDGGGKAEVGAEAHLGGAASSAPGGQRPPSPLVASLDAAPAPAAAPVSPVKDQLGGDAAASPQAQMQVGYVPAAAGSTSDGRRPTARPGSSNNAGGTPQGAGPPVSTGPGTTGPAFSDTVPLGIGMPAGSGGGSGSPKPGSPEPSSPQTPGRRVQDSASSHSLLHSLWCCSSDVLLASDRLQGGGSALAVDFRCSGLPVVPAAHATRASARALASCIACTARCCRAVLSPGRELANQLSSAFLILHQGILGRLPRTLKHHSESALCLPAGPGA